MVEVTKLQVETVLKAFIDPYMDRDLVTANAVRQVVVEKNRVQVEIVLGYPALGYHAELAAALTAQLEALEGVQSAQVQVSSQIMAHAVQRGVNHARDWQLARHCAQRDRRGHRHRGRQPF